MQHFIDFLAPQKQLSKLQGFQIGPHKVLVYLGKFRLQALQTADIALDFCPAKQLCRFQPVQSGNPDIVLVNRDGVSQPHRRNAVRQFPHGIREGFPPS